MYEGGVTSSPEEAGVGTSRKLNLGSQGERTGLIETPASRGKKGRLPNKKKG